MTGLEVDRDIDGGWIRSGQAGGKDSGTDIAGYLADTQVEAEMGVLNLGDSYCVVKRGGYVDSARNDIAQVLGSARFLGETRGGNDGSFKGARERNADAAEETAGKASALATDAIDGAVSELEAEVDEEGYGWMEPFLGSDGVNIFVVVGVLSSESECLFKVAGDELIASTGNEAGCEAWSPRAKFTVFDGNDLAAEDVHSVVVPQLAESALGGVGAVAESVNAAGVAELSAVGEAFNEVDGLDVADDFRTIDEVVSDGRMREEMAFLGINHISSGSDESAGLALKGEMLGLDCDRSE